MSKNSEDYCIVVAAGKGERLGAALPKALVQLNGKAIIAHSITQLLQTEAFSKIVVTYPKGFEDHFHSALEGVIRRESYLLVEGGKTRQQSVRFALEALREMASPPDSESFVAVHDAARCLVSPDLVKRTLVAAKEFNAAIAALPEVETIKRVDPVSKKVLGTLKREELWRAQTPQIFRFSLLWDAHVKGLLEQWSATDDASLVERLAAVYVVTGEEKNMKITTPEDIHLAEALLKAG